jgi:predicted permease
MNVGRFHWALIGAVGAVLLVACANLANLQLARGIARARELAVRAAVGANRRQLVMHLMLESAILAVVGMILGVATTVWANSLIKASIPPVMSEYLIAPQTSWGMFAFATIAALLCLVLAGLLPALKLSRVDLETVLKAGAGTGANRHHRRRYGMLVIAQVAFALPVLIGAAIVLRAAVAMNGPDYRFRRMYGYDASPLVVGSVLLRTDSMFTTRPTRLNDVANDLVARATTVRDVDVAAVQISRRPVRSRIMVDDENGALREVPAPLWSYSIVSPQYLRTFQQGIEKGRDFADGEFDGRSVIMDAPSARYLWGSHDPIGRAIKFGDAKSDMPWLTVVGITRDDRDTATIRRVNPTANYRLDEVYRVIAPSDSVVTSRSYEAITMYARTRGSTELASVRIQRSLGTVARYSRPNVVPLEQRHGAIASRARQSFVASLFGTFAIVGLGLVAIGVFGIVAHSIEERRRELAVRISLGATARNVLHAVLREGNVLLLAGIAVGLLLTRDSIWWLGNFLDEDGGFDAPFMALVAAGLFFVAAVAATWPAWRATRIDPVEALRHE